MDEIRVCGRCASKIKNNPRPYCQSCGRSLTDPELLCPDCQREKFYFKRAYSACLHEGVLKELIHIFKYKGRAALGSILSRLMIDFIRDNDSLLHGIDAITFVPRKDGRFRSRDFNQSEVLAYNISQEFGIPLMNTLKKTRTTRPQNELSREKRLTNLKGTISVKDGDAMKEMTFLLIDDVMTTGATLNESSKALLSGGAREVRCLTLSRGL